MLCRTQEQRGDKTDENDFERLAAWNTRLCEPPCITRLYSRDVQEKWCRLVDNFWSQSGRSTKSRNRYAVGLALHDIAQGLIEQQNRGARAFFGELKTVNWGARNANMVRNLIVLSSLPDITIRLEFRTYQVSENGNSVGRPVYGIVKHIERRMSFKER